MQVGVFTDPRMLDHRVPARHPERPERLQAILRHLERTGYLASSQDRRVREATEASSSGVTQPITCAGSPSLESAGRWNARPGYLGFAGLESCRAGWRPGPASRPSRSCWKRRAAGAVRGSPAGTPCTAEPPAWGSASTRTSPWPRRRRSLAIRAQPGADRRFRRPSWQWHAGDLLRVRPGRVPVDPPLSVLSRERVRATRPAPGRAWAAS